MGDHRTSNWKRQRRLWLFAAILMMSCGLRIFAQTQWDSGSDVRKTPSGTALGDIFFKSRNSLIFSLSAGAVAQDNVLFSDTDSRTFDTSADLSGRIAYQRQYQRTSFGLDYSLGSRIYNQNTQYNQLTHVGGFDLQYRMTERLTFGLHDRISVVPESRNFFGRDFVLDPAPANILPNSSLVLPLNNTVTNTTSANLSYALNPTNAISIGVDYSLGTYQSSGLQDQNRYGTGLSYSYRLAERTTLSLGYAFSYFHLAPSQFDSTTDLPITPSGTTTHHHSYIGISHELTPSISGFVKVGPSVITGDSIDVGTGVTLRPGVYASINAGVVLSKSVTLDPRTFFSFGVNQDISDGSGLGAVAQTQTAYVSLGRLLTRKINMATTAGYARNKFLNSFDSDGREVITNGISAGANLRISLTERLGFYTAYSYVRQLSTGFYQAIPDRLAWNGILVGLSYSFPVFF